MAEKKTKMTVTQLTVIVAVNMMGSGIIMLPANMAQVGAISLTSWLVTAVGSMCIAYGFAQAGIFDKKAGGMSSYAEAAHGRSGFFMVSYLYYISLAIANVAIATSALGYLVPFMPGLKATPLISTLAIIALIWITTLANFGGPKITGQIGAITVWGVILPVAGLSLIGWFWFDSSIFSAAWNPHGLGFFEGLSSSITLTLWAFLGMESASQSAGAVENPRRDVPLACLLGTGGAAVVYILSTTVIQGIVPNAELATSSGPFGLVYAQMFSPEIGKIVMALAAMACIGSLLGWQFTISQTGKIAADDGVFPAFLGKVNKFEAPVVGMIVIGIVQTIFAISTMSPDLSKAFGVLVDLSVVTNVVPYVMALSGLMMMMRTEGVDQATYRRNSIVTVIAILYSTYALYASGGIAVIGGIVIMSFGYMIFGFLTANSKHEMRQSKTAKKGVAQ